MPTAITETYLDAGASLPAATPPDIFGRRRVQLWLGAGSCSIVLKELFGEI